MFDDYPLTRRRSGEKVTVAPESSPKVASTVEDYSIHRQQKEKSNRIILICLRSLFLLGCTGLCILGIFSARSLVESNIQSFYEHHAAFPIDGSVESDKVPTECKSSCSLAERRSCHVSRQLTRPNFCRPSSRCTSIYFVLKPKYTECRILTSIAFDRIFSFALLDWYRRHLGSSLVIEAIPWLWNLHHSRHSQRRVHASFTRCCYYSIPRGKASHQHALERRAK